MILGCMTELPCPQRKDRNGTGHCMKAEGDCEYQILDGGGDNVGRLTEKEGSSWHLKNVPWESLGEGQIISKDVSERVYGALCRLKDYEDTGLSPEDVERLQYTLEDVIAINLMEKQIPLPLEEWHEDYGDCLWWRFPIEEPPYCGNPLDSEWQEKNYGDYYTHFTRLIIPELIS